MSYPANFTMLKRGYGVTDPAHTVQKYPIGTTFTDEAGNVFEYVKTASAATIPVSGMCILPAAGAVALTTTNAGTYAGCRCGVAQVAVTAITSTYQYLWVQTKTGACKTTSLSVAASCAAYDNIYTTATAGVVDDAVTVQIIGVLIGTAATGAAIATTAYLYFPYVPTAA
jgi:hypothetical protein